MCYFRFVKHVLVVIGTRPNFIKVTQMKKAAETYQIELHIVHTGQHYDANMAKVFFEEFKLVPDTVLSLQHVNVADQIGGIIRELSKVMVSFKPDLVVVVGDVNSTLAGAIAANKLGIPIAHLESGLRSRDRSMPEEINRILTDEITDLFFVTEESGLRHLLQEGKSKEQIHFVGNTMIDTMVAFEAEIDEVQSYRKQGLEEKGYMLMTFHRPALVDNADGLNQLIDLLERAAKLKKVVLPLHPRTKMRLQEFGLWDQFASIPNLNVLGPVGYFEFQNLIKHAFCIVTDSGGIQEETTFRQIPCLTVRPNTERPSTIDVGTNTLVDIDPPRIIHLIESMIEGTYKQGEIPEFWDGKATERIMQVIANQVGA